MSVATLAKPERFAALPVALHCPAETWRRLPYALLVIVLCLTALSTVGQVAKHVYGHARLHGFVDLFYVDEEASLTTWYSSVSLLLAAALLALIAVAESALRRPDRRHWAALAALFALLSADEIAQIHEHPIAPMRDLWDLGGVLYYGWVLPGAAFAALVGLAFLRFLRRLPRPVGRQMLLAGGIFLGGALGVEMLSGAWADQHGEDNLTYALIVTAEELCEMLGVVVFVQALVAYLPRAVAAIDVRLAPPETNAP